MNWDSFLSFIQKKEKNTVKFFGSNCSSDDFGSIVTAFANTKGGFVVIGFDINNYHLTGSTITKEWVDKLLQSFCTPKIEYEFFTIEKLRKSLGLDRNLQLKKMKRRLLSFQFPKIMINHIIFMTNVTF